MMRATYSLTTLLGRKSLDASKWLKDSVWPLPRKLETEYAPI
ncbi:Unknown protein sequence [Pseudomonas amygdali pv. mellea]|nr:Unknown protein sequence [Pseudomonas amygdali pv. mellea]